MSQRSWYFLFVYSSLSQLRETDFSENLNGCLIIFNKSGGIKMNALQKSNLFPFAPLYSDLFENNFSGSKFSNNIPAVNIKENEKEFKVEVAAPGLKKEDFRITVEDGLINISAEQEKTKEEKKEENNEDYTMKEYNYNSFSRSFALPDNVREDDINAGYENGILKLNLPKKTELSKDSKKKMIKVS